MCGLQHVDKHGIDNIFTDAIVLVFVICPSVVVALFVGEVFACRKMKPKTADLHSSSRLTYLPQKTRSKCSSDPPRFACAAPCLESLLVYSDFVGGKGLSAVAAALPPRLDASHGDI